MQIFVKRKMSFHFINQMVVLSNFFERERKKKSLDGCAADWLDEIQYLKFLKKKKKKEEIQYKQIH